MVVFEPTITWLPCVLQPIVSITEEIDRAKSKENDKIQTHNHSIWCISYTTVLNLDGNWMLRNHFRCQAKIFTTSTPPSTILTPEERKIRRHQIFKFKENCESFNLVQKFLSPKCDKFLSRSSSFINSQRQPQIKTFAFSAAVKMQNSHSFTLSATRSLDF